MDRIEIGMESNLLHCELVSLDPITQSSVFCVKYICVEQHFFQIKVDKGVTVLRLFGIEMGVASAEKPDFNHPNTMIINFKVLISGSEALTTMMMCPQIS